MNENTYEKNVRFDDVNPVDFYGVNNSNLNMIKETWPDVKFIARGNSIRTLGEPGKLELIHGVLQSILEEIRTRGPLQKQRVAEILQSTPEERRQSLKDGDVLVHGARGTVVRARSEGQKKIVDTTRKDDVVFAVGPAGSGKTYTAVAIAVNFLKAKKVRKIVLVRPAVEAGENLGFLPGDLKDKIDPYLRPLYDALEDMIHSDKLKHLMERNTIEIVPLAYMRGRTLNNAFIILDEAQNATEMQLKMFLTRLGVGSKAIVTGDITQIDLPRSQRSGLIQATKILDDIPGIGFVFLEQKDVVRHPIIRKIITAYEKAEDEATRGKADAKKDAKNDHARSRPPEQGN